MRTSRRSAAGQPSRACRSLTMVSGSRTQHGPIQGRSTTSSFAAQQLNPRGVDTPGLHSVPPFVAAIAVARFWTTRIFLIAGMSGHQRGRLDSPSRLPLVHVLYDSGRTCALATSWVPGCVVLFSTPLGLRGMVPPTFWASPATRSARSTRGIRSSRTGMNPPCLSSSPGSW